MLSISYHLNNAEQPMGVYSSVNVPQESYRGMYSYLCVSCDGQEVGLFLNLEQIQALKKELGKMEREWNKKAPKIESEQPTEAL